MKIKDKIEGSELTSILQVHFGKQMNLARIKFISLFLCALCRTNSVNFERLATVFSSTAERGSSLRRIQRFISEYELCTTMIAQVIVVLLPAKPPFSLSMDRTNWKFGEVNINILVIAIGYKGLAFPVLFTMLPKRGNSNTKERIDIMNRFISIFGHECIKHLTADREFVGDQWIGYLNRMQINYYLRIRNNFYVTRHGKMIKVSHLFNSVRIGEFISYPHIYLIGNEHVYLAASKIKNKEGVAELQVIVSFTRPINSLEAYKERWQIESAFKSLKTGGFNIEDTHLRDIQRIGKLFALVLIAYTWAYIVGLYVHRNIKPIRICKHKYKAKSFVKVGIETIAAMLFLGKLKERRINVFEFLSCS